MGYNTIVTGAIQISPPLTWAEIKRGQFNLQGQYEVWIDPDHDVRETDTGRETVITAEFLEPSHTGGKHHKLVEHVQAFADLYSKPGRTFTRYLECVGEEQPDMWRVAIKNGKAVTTRAAVLWPEDVADLKDALHSGSAHNAHEAADALYTRLQEIFNRADRS